MKGVSNCGVLRSDGMCQECVAGYFVDVRGSCHRLPMNCKYGNVQTLGCI